jgi:hypothetical protein
MGSQCSATCLVGLITERLWVVAAVARRRFLSLKADRFVTHRGRVVRSLLT